MKYNSIIYVINGQGLWINVRGNYLILEMNNPIIIGTVQEILLLFFLTCYKGISEVFVNICLT